MDHDVMKACVDGCSLTVVISTLIGILPAISALLSVVWMGIRVYETETIQKLLKRKKNE